MFRLKVTSINITMVVGLIVLSMITPSKLALADGGFGGSAFSHASSDTFTEVTSDFVGYSSETFSNAGTYTSRDGILEGFANAGNNTRSEVIGSAYYDQKNTGKAAVFTKGDNVMAKARSETETTIFIDGQAWIVSVEVARALARHTDIGTTAGSTADTNVSAVSNGYIGVNTGTKTEANVRIQR